ncbi:MAG TPA: hypothetical protein VG845_13000, partial [Dehalococcoidia bacterium]|nr:hypothetical protein [Dehalococcoidia bacterium]
DAEAWRGSTGAGGNQPALRHGVSSETAMAHCRDYETRGLYGASGQGGSGYGGTSEGSTSPGTAGLPSVGLRSQGEA